MAIDLREPVIEIPNFRLGGDDPLLFIN